MTFPFIDTHTATEWAAWDGQNHAVDEDGATIATAERVQYVDPTPLLGDPPLPFEVADLSVDDCGDLWLLTTAGTLYRYDAEAADLRRIHCTWDDPPSVPRGIAVTADTVYVAIGASPDAGAATDDAAGGRVHAFARHPFQTRWIADEPYDDPLALGHHRGTVSILDRGEGAPFVAEIGRGGAPVGEATGFRTPVDLAVDTVGDRYVLDHAAGGDEPSIRRIAAGETGVETSVPADQFETPETGAMPAPSALAAASPGDLIVGTGTAAPTEPSLFRYDLAEAAFERLASFSGPVAELLARRDEVGSPGLYVVGDPRDSLSFLSAADRYQRNPVTGRYEGAVATRLDAGEHRTEWHRLTVALPTTPAGTQVRVFYGATDDDDLRPGEPWIGSPTPLTRLEGIGANIAGRLREAGVRRLLDLVVLSPERLAELAETDDFHVSTSQAADWIDAARDVLDDERAAADFDWQSIGPPNPEDALLSDATGRYLWVKVALIGTPSAAPRVNSLRAYFPRQSYLRYLPAVYQEDVRSAAFLEQYLSLFESVFTDVEEEITAATRYLDPDGVPGEALSWLAGWLALSPDETWSTAAERELVRRAHELFKQRGTREGLRGLLSIYLGDRATRPPAWQWALDRQRTAIDEREATGDLTPEAADRLRTRLDRTVFLWEETDLDCIEDPDVRATYERLLPCPQCFAVLLWPSLSDDAVREAQRIIDSTRPAHAVGRGIRLQPWVRLAGHERDSSHHTYLGVNSALADREFVLESSGLGTDTRLSEREASGQYGTRERLGIDTDLS